MEENIVVREQNEKKQRKLKSKVWDEFTKTKLGEDGKQWAICNHCGERFDGSSKKGTTHLKNHLESKICRNKRKRDNNGNTDKSTKTATPVVMVEKSSVSDLIKQSFDKNRFRTKFWDPSVLNSRKDEILKIYQKEKEKLREFLNNLSCRLSLHIVPMYTHLLLIVHYIDDCWERQIKIISILSRENYMEETKESCLDWKIDRNICTALACFMGADDDDKEVIESWFSERGSLSFAGFVPDVQGFISEIRFLTHNWEMVRIDGLRECVDYVYNTPSNKIKLQLAVNKAVTMGKKVTLDVDRPSDWQHFEYLKVAVGLKEAFSELEKIDPDFISINLTKKKWDEATATFPHLKALREFSYRFCWDNCSTTTITTIVVDILKSFRCPRSEDCDVCKNTSYKKLFDKFKVYLVLVILDPRFKMDTLRRWYEEIYGSDAEGYLQKTFKYFMDTYNKYVKDSREYKILDAMGRPCKSSTKSEFELYLNELKVPAVEEFDILPWWRGNAHFYPTLARMARDYLAIPIQIDIDSTYIKEICLMLNSEIDYNMLSALIYLRGLLYY